MLRLSTSCGIVRTTGKHTTLRLTLRGFPSVVLDSIVVPRVGKLRFYRRMGSGPGLTRVPFIVLATGILSRRVGRKCDILTSSCVLGPFGVAILGTGMRDVVGGERRLHQLFNRGVSTVRIPVPRVTTISPFVSGLVRLVGRGTSSSRLRMDSLCRTVKCKQVRFFEGVGTISKVSPGGLVIGVQVGVTTSVLHRGRCAVSRVTCRAKFSSPSCFSEMFGSMFRVAPGRCRGGVG